MNKFLSITSVFISVVLLFFFPVSGQTGELAGIFSCSAGVVSTHDDFGRTFDLDERAEVGVMCEAAKPSWPVAVVAGYSLSYGHSKTADIFCSETRLGIKKTLDRHPSIKPYMTAGFTGLNVYADTSGDDDHEGAYGTWYGAGITYRMTHTWYMNLGWRRSRINMKLFGERLDAGGDHFDWSIGYRFPP